MVAKTFNNNIFQVLTHIDKKDYNYFKNLSDEQLKDMQPYTLLKWLSHVSTDANKAEYYTLVTNELVNNNFWKMSKYKDLQLQLLCACGCGSWTKHGWLKTKTVSKKDKKINELRKFFYNLTDEEFEYKVKNMDKKELEDTYNNLGIT